MFWTVVFLVAGIGFAAMPIAHFASYLLTIVSFTLIYSVLGRTEGIIAWLMLVPTFFLAVWAGLFIYARYLEASMPHALVVSIAAAIVNGICMWFIERTIELSIGVTVRVPEHPALQVLVS